MDSSKKTAKLAASLLLVPIFTACSGEKMTPSYARSDVQPVTVERIDPDSIAIRYYVPPQSMYFAAGIDYASDENALRVTIHRCENEKPCMPMSRAEYPLADGLAEARIPFAGDSVTFVYSDQEVPMRVRERSDG